jgi:ankyrin repeat protein
VDRLLSSPLLLPRSVFAGAQTAAILLKHGANPNILSSDGRSALQFVKIADQVRVLIEHGADPTLGTSPLLSAILQRRVDVVRALSEAGANPNTLSWASSDNNAALYPLHGAAEGLTPKSIEIAEACLGKKRTDGARASQPTEQKWLNTPLNIYCTVVYSGHLIPRPPTWSRIQV